MEYTIELTDAQAERLIATANALNAHGVQTLVYVDSDTQRGYCGNVLVHIADQIAAERERNRPLVVGDKVRLVGTDWDGVIIDKEGGSLCVKRTSFSGWRTWPEAEVERVS